VHVTTDPPLALFDLDNTLIDRDRAFRRWAAEFAASRRKPGEVGGEVEWLVQTDDDGFCPRETLFEQIRGRYALDHSVADLIATYRADLRQYIGPDRSTLEALGRLRRRGWKLGIVTNGDAFQNTKVDAAGLRAVIDGCAVSAAVGVSKPDPMIFHAAAALCGYSGDGAPPCTWIIGDNPSADIAGAVACGFRCIWIDRGREWDERNYRPDLTANNIPEAVRQLMRAQPQVDAPAQNSS
jgi:putative hydrolase of the HAD superfamily